MLPLSFSAGARAVGASLILSTIFLAPSWAEGVGGSEVPNFSPDSRVGWIVGVPDGETPIGQDFLPPPSGPGPVTFDRAYPYFDSTAARRAGAQQTLRIADLSNPILQPWAREALRKVNEQARSALVMMTPKERCWPIGVPGFLLYPVTPVYFLQTPKEVVMVWQEDHMARHVYLADKHSTDLKPSWFGESIGHYENGDTLVIDTIGLNTKTFIEFVPHPAYRAIARRRAVPAR